MQSKRRRWPWVIAGIVALLVLAERLLLATAAPPGAAYAIDLVALHKAAVAGGALPDHIEVERVGEFKFPRTVVVAGDGFRMHPMVLLAHRVVWPDRSVLIDTAMGPDAAKKLPGSKIDATASDRVQAAMKKASDIVFTHEHVDHVGGVASAPDASAIAKQVHMTTEQLASPKLERGEFKTGALEHLAPLAYQGLYAVAPGVVLQKAPGHSPGSQLIYVELANGQRYLFVGDIAWTLDNITLQRGRPRIAELLMKEDRAAVAAQLRTLAGLQNDVHVVAAHDPVALEADLKAGLYRQGFSGL